MKKPTSLLEACDRIAHLEGEMEVMLGRLNALHEVLQVLVLEREGPTEDVVAHLRLTRERTTGALLGSPLPESMIKEHLRVTGEFQAFAESVVQTRGKPRWNNGQPAFLEQ